MDIIRKANSEAKRERSRAIRSRLPVKTRLPIIWRTAEYSVYLMGNQTLGYYKVGMFKQYVKTAAGFTVTV